VLLLLLLLTLLIHSLVCFISKNIIFGIKSARQQE
jgi:hypothetical protein